MVIIGWRCERDVTRDLVRFKVGVSWNLEVGMR